MGDYGDSWPPPAARTFLSVAFPIDAFGSRSDGLAVQSKILAVLERCPRQPRILGGDGNDRFPVAAPFNEAPCPATEAILLVAKAVEDSTRTHDQQAPEVAVTGLGDAPEPGFSTAAVLTRCQTDPGGHLSAIVKVVRAAEAGEQCAGGGGADAGELHQAFAARIFAGGQGDGAVVLGNQDIEPVGVREHVTNALVGVTRQVFEVGTDLAAQADHFLRQDDAEFGDQAAQAVVDRGAFFDKALPRAMQGEDDLLVFFLDGYEAHVGPGDGFADGCGVRRVVLAALAAHAVGGDELGGDEPDGVAVLPEQPGPVVGTGAGFHADQAGRELGDQGRQLFARDLRLDQCGLAVFIDAVNGKDVLGEIDTYRHNAHGLPLSWF